MDEIKRTSYCGSLGLDNVGQNVTVMGWVDRTRDLGGVNFIDLRDREGIVQIVIDPDKATILDLSKSLRAEHVIAVEGLVVKRSKDTVNPEIKTGKIEVHANHLRVLSRSNTPPFPINKDDDTTEETRLRYRYLDLRRPRMQSNIRLRHKVCMAIRNYLDQLEFLEIETPILTNSTPEGARDYLVPSRLHPGHFYALPQSPQIFKQLLMIGGFDKYFQIVRCFRDEDLRADRQPEFTQVDLEVSFPSEEIIFKIVEGLLREVFSITKISLPEKIPHLSYTESINRFGTDRPDTRFELELIDLGSSFIETPFRIFQDILGTGGVIKGIRVKGGSSFSRAKIDNFSRFVSNYGAPALSWIRHVDKGLKSSLPKVVPFHELEKSAHLAKMSKGDLLFILAGDVNTVNDALGALRINLAQQLDLIPSDQNNFLWIRDFPLVTWDKQAKRFMSLHHPFTSPTSDGLEQLSQDPGKAMSRAYDIILNGQEIGGGSIRIHDPIVQRQIFKLLGIPDKEAEQRFGFLLEALKYGAPPHGGIALGLDRIIMTMTGEPSIRDVIPFPKTARAQDLMCGAPSPVKKHHLRELSLNIS